jgi:signal transduction histidine kinase
MTDNSLVDRLASHRTLGKAPRKELEWLAAHGNIRRLQAGDLVATKNAPIENIWIVLSGRMAIFVDRGAGSHKMMEWREGDVSGVLPYSRMKNPPGDTRALEDLEVLAIPVDCHREMIRECQEVTSILVHIMLDRARVFTSSDLHDEKMVSLGKLSAGLAHELNNPAAAIERTATLLAERLAGAEEAARSLGGARLSDAQLAAVDAARESCLATRTAGVRSPIEQAEHEDAIAAWLSAHRLDPKNAEALAETAVTTEALDRLAAAVEGPALDLALRWAANACAVRALAREIQEAAIRISGIVLAVKGFTHMDQATVAEPVDLARGLSNTVAVLRSKAKTKSASVTIQVEPDLPRVLGFAGELNQVWGNLIDNALDAIPEGGRVDVLAARENGSVVVRIVDHGSGIPEEIQGRIFDPFFTTKPMGEGTGLGLDIVRRLVRHNDGEISVESRPGRTEFRVVLQRADAP